METPGTTRAVLRRVALRALLVALALGGVLFLSGETRAEVARDPAVAVGMGFFALVVGASTAPIAWVESGALLRRDRPQLRLGLAGIATAALGPSIVAQMTWTLTLLDTGSAEKAWAAVASLPAELEANRELGTTLVVASLLWPFLLLGVAEVRLGAIGRGGRLLLHVLCFPSSLVLVGLAGAADALDVRLFGTPGAELPEAGGPPPPPAAGPPERATRAGG